MAFIGNQPTAVPLTSSQLVDGIITTAKLAADAVTSAKIADGAIVNVDVNSTAAVAYSKLNLATSIVNADISASAAIATTKLGTGAVLQVVSTTKTDVFTASLNNSFTDITGLSVSITPSSTSNKILIISMINYGNNSVYPAALRLLRDSTLICAGPASGNRQSLTVSPQGKGDNDINRGMNNIITFLDSPSTTSSTTYKIQGGILQSSGTLSCNTTGNDIDTNYMGRSASTIIVMEIKG